MPVRTKKIRVGCAGFSGARSDYYRQFDCVEIGSSFYNLPQLRTVERWRDQAPPGFVFTMKAWQVITHRATSPTYRRTRLDDGDREHCGFFGFNPTVRWAWDQTLAVATALGVRLVLFQSPAGFRPTKQNTERLRSFFERCKRGKLLLGWEPRSPAWEPDRVEQLGRELDLVPVTDPLAMAGDGLAGGGPRRFRYYRLAGVGGPRQRYSDDQLDQLAAHCRAPGGRETICVFGNLASGLDAARLQKKLGVEQA